MKRTGNLSINSENIYRIAKYVEQLEEYAQYGKAYREQLEKDYIRYGGLCFNGSNGVMTSTAKKLSVNELEECVKLYKNAVEGNGAFAPQLIPQGSTDRDFYNKQEYSI